MPAAGVLGRHQTETGRELPAVAKLFGRAEGGDERIGADRADADEGARTPTAFIRLGMGFDPGVAGDKAFAYLPPVRGQLVQQSLELIRQASGLVEIGLCPAQGHIALGYDHAKLGVRFFRTDAGNEPVREWLKSLLADDRKVIGDDIRTVQYAWPVGIPLTRPLGGRLHEARSNLSGNRIARVIFFVIKDEAVLLHGFIKKSRKTPKADLDLARERLKRLLAPK